MLAFALAAALSSTANAASWAEFSAAFPAFPCSDGWMGCIVGKNAVNPDLARDSRGMPIPADLRVGFFDLEPQPTFSPFGPLSTYTPVPPGPVRSAAPAIVALSPKTVVGDNSKLPRTREEQPLVTEQLVVKQQSKVVEEQSKVVEAPSLELVSFEPAAMIGHLSAEQVTSLEQRYHAASLQTDKTKVSALLMSNAFSSGDLSQWERLVRRHLAEVDQSDPDISYKYAIYLSKAGRSKEAIRWAGLALERSMVWSGPTFTDRVSTLHKIRAIGAQSIWSAAETEAAEAGNDASRTRASDARSQAKVIAREWYDFLSAAGKDTTKARLLCEAAAGTGDYCDR